MFETFWAALNRDHSGLALCCILYYAALKNKYILVLTEYCSRYKEKRSPAVRGL